MIGQSAGRSSGNPTSGRRTPQMARRYIVPFAPVDQLESDLGRRRGLVVLASVLLSVVLMLVVGPFLL